MPEMYAEALWQAIERGTKPKNAVESLSLLLEREGRMNLLPRIKGALARIASREASRRNISLSVAREKDIRSALKEVAPLLVQMEAARDGVVTNVAPELIGGWRLEGRNQLVDKSFKNQLLSIYKNVIHS